MKRKALQMAVVTLSVMFLFVVSASLTYAGAGQTVNSNRLVASAPQIGSFQLSVAAKGVGYSAPLAQSTSDAQNPDQADVHSLRWTSGFFIFLFALVTPVVLLGLVVAVCKIQDRKRNRLPHDM